MEKLVINVSRETLESEVKMKINVHAGHNPSGKIACGAVSLLNESDENRRVKDLVIKALRELGHTVYDCTVDNGKSKSDILVKIVKKCNAHNVDLDVSIHFNAGVSDTDGNGKSCGTEVLVYDFDGNAKEYADRIVKEIATLGFRNRGVKERPKLYFLNKTNAPALLVECCFTDDKDDVKMYNAEKMANAIVKGITGTTPTYTPSTPPDVPQKEEKVRYYPKYNGKTNSLVDALNSLGIDSSKAHRKEIATANGFSDYAYSATHNVAMLNLLKKGLLKREV